ncbi:MAG: carboxymuconolactone decarboxylase family protein [Chloroflexota bacterium]
MNTFKCRLYPNIGEFVADFRFIMSNRPLVRKTMRGELISQAFRERLMMVVTQVNGCRYCSYFHAQEALKAGISEGELKSLLAGAIPDDCPPEEYPALLYAQHWAESNAQPDPEVLQRLVETYGQEKSDAIHIVLRMIRVGNLMGNLGDYLLYRISFGRWGY